MRLENKIALIVGAGQAPGKSEAIGNGRATALVFAREGAKVCCLDRYLEVAQETAEMINEQGSEAFAIAADVTDEDAIKNAVTACTNRWERIDILHNNVGISVEGGDAALEDITLEAFDRIMDVNLLGTMLTCKHVVPVMREQGGGAIVNISSASAYWTGHPTVLYPASKMAMISFTRQVAITNADRGVRANVILPGLMDTPMAVDRRVETLGRSRDDIAAERDARVPLLNKMGTGWDVAHAALFLASEEASFDTGIEMPVAGGSLARVGCSRAGHATQGIHRPVSTCQTTFEKTPRTFLVRRFVPSPNCQGCQKYRRQTDFLDLALPTFSVEQCRIAQPLDRAGQIKYHRHPMVRVRQVKLRS